MPLFITTSKVQKSLKAQGCKAAKLRATSKYLLPRINLHVPILVVASPWLQCVESGPLRKPKVRLSAVPIYPPINSPSHPSVHPSIWFYLMCLSICLFAIQLSIYASTHLYSIVSHGVSDWWAAHSQRENLRIQKYAPGCRKKSKNWKCLKTHLSPQKFEKQNFQNC